MKIFFIAFRILSAQNDIILLLMQAISSLYLLFTGTTVVKYQDSEELI